MSNSSDSFDSGILPSPYRRDQATSNEMWMFGGAFAGLLLVGFAFGVWAGAPPAKPKATETAEVKKEKEPVKPVPAPVAPVVTPAKKDEPKTEPEPEPKPKPEPKKVEPVPKKTEPEPMKVEPPAKKVEPEPKKADRVVLFKEIQPILRANCNECHGDAKGKPKGGVDTRTLAGILKSDGPPLVPGKPNDSSLYASVKDDSMPPDPKKKLTDAEKKLLHDWILGGAKE